MRKGFNAGAVDTHVRIPAKFYQELESRTRRMPRISVNMLILAAIEEYVKRLDEVQSKNVVEK